MIKYGKYDNPFEAQKIINTCLNIRNICIVYIIKILLKPIDIFLQNINYYFPLLLRGN